MILKAPRKDNCQYTTFIITIYNVFHFVSVVMVRMICSVISKDQAYQGLFSTVKEIYKEEGLAGFYRLVRAYW